MSDEVMAELLRADGQIKALMDALCAVRDHPDATPGVRAIAERAIYARYGKTPDSA